MQLTIEIPDHIYVLLNASHPNGATAAAALAIKRHLTAKVSTQPGRPKGTNADRDAAITDKALAGTRHASLANEYNLSIIRIQQIVAQGKASAYARQADQTRATIQSLFGNPKP